MIKQYFLLFPLFSSLPLLAQQIKNVQFHQSDKQVIVTYDLTQTQNGQTFDVTLWISENNGFFYEGPLRYVRGDVGFEVTGGSGKRIVWEALKERKEVVGNRIKFKVEATIKGDAPQPEVLEGMVFVEGGTFQMGDVFNEGKSNEKPIHTVTVSSFYMSQYEVTNEEYAAFLNAKDNQTEGEVTWLKIESSYCKIEKSGNRFVVKSGYSDHPVVRVSWYGARAYCDWRTEVTGKTHRLPTEAEWEYAARERGRKVRFGNGKNIANPTEMNFNGQSDYKKSYSVVGQYRVGTVPVNSFSPNALSLYNMSGNVYEWCSDWYGDYSSGSSTNPKGASSGPSRVIRGGSWDFTPYGCRVAFRNSSTPAYRFHDVGFRLVVP